MRPRRLRMIAALLLMLGFASTSAAKTKLPELVTVPRVELARYCGTWYEIASFPQWFQRGCTATKATYILRTDGRIDVINECWRKTLDGKYSIARGIARAVDKVTNSKLEVSFFWLIWGDYWIIDLGADYEFAVVGHPSRDFLWILSRQPVMDDAVYNAICQRLVAQGYDLAKLQRTLQRIPDPAAP